MRLDFVNPEFLWFLVSLPLLIVTHFYFLRHAKAKAMKFANFETLKRITGKELITKNISALLLRCAVLVFVIFAAAGPELWYLGASNENDYVIAIDISLSMTTTDLPPTRLEASKDLATEFVNGLQGDSSIGIISFSGITFVDLAPVSDKARSIRTVRALQPNEIGGTDLSGALITGTNLLLNSQKGKVLILMSDGSHTAGSEGSIRQALDYVKKNHVILHSIAVGTERGLVPYLPQEYNVSAIFNREILKELSEATAGMYSEVLDPEGLEQTKQALFQKASLGLLHRELSYFFILVSLTLLFVEWGLLNTSFRRIP